MRLPLLLLSTIGCTPRSDGDTSTADDSATGSTRVSVEVVTVRGPVTCAEPEAREQQGPFRAWTSEAWEAQPVNRTEGGFDDYSGWGVSVADFDGDENPDLLLVDHATLQLWLADGAGGFRQGPDPIRAGTGLAMAAVAGDLDGDGDLDALLSADGGDELLLNDGTGRLTGRIGNPAVFPSVGGKFSLTLGDVDGDGDLDAFLPVFGRTEGVGPDEQLPDGEGSRLAMNDGAGTFSSGDHLLPAAANIGYPFTAALVDTDDDGDPDLLLANDHGNRARPSQHWRNDGGTFVDVSAETGADLRLTAMGLGLGDLGGDRTLDVAVSGTRELALMEGDGTGRYVQTGAARGYTPDLDAGQHVAWGVEMGDANNDGLLDIFTAYGWFPTDPEHDLAQPDSLHLQSVDGSFTDVAPVWGLDDTGWARGAILVDLDGDGWLDLVRRRVHDLPTVHLARCGSNGWLKVDLRGTSANTHAIGALVELEADGRVQTRQVLAGGHSIASSAPPIVHFGLGAAQQIDRVTVRWPDGAVSELGPVDTNQHIRLTRSD